MATLNPRAINLWLFGTALGFAIAGPQGAAIGLAIVTGVMFLAEAMSA